MPVVELWHPNGRIGKIIWEKVGTNGVKYQIINEDAETQERLHEFFNRKHPYMIPQSQRIDDYEIVEARPVVGFDYFQMRVCELMAEFGDVTVKWLS